MSGGSWDYLYHQIEDAADRLSSESMPLRRALGAHMKLIAQAMHKIEWVDSCDCGPGDEIEAIKEVFGELAEIKEIEILLSDGRQVIDALKEFGC